ncbi:MAG: hypothetical protein V4678_04735 [Patescibacteria group bacterium]
MCNINTAEVAYRKKAMWFGIILSVVIFAVLLLLGASWWLGAIFLFIPVYIGAIGYLQVRNRFCVSYGSKGQQNADESGESAQAVTDNEAIAADKTKTRRMNIQALGITLAVLLIASAALYVA